MMILVYLAFLLISIVKLLYFTYLFQIKEYRLDRIKSFYKEVGFLKFFYGVEIKKPAKTTRNLFILFSAFLPEFILFLYLTEIPYYFGFIAFVLAPLIACVCVYILVFLTSIPVAIHRGNIILKAKMKVRKSNAVFIGVTGSYGKSTVKEYLYQILSSKYNVAKTDKNMNTDVGVALCVLKNLTPETEYFIAEIGAYTRGEVKNAAKVVKPTYGILTALGNQHVDLFGSKENLIKGKFELIDILPESGKSYINKDTLDDKKDLKHYKVPTILFSTKKNADIHANNIRVVDNELAAHIIYRDKKIDIQTSLIGEHNISNLLPCIALAFDLGMSAQEIQKAIKNIQPVPGKLSVEKGKNKSTILNDSYNSNVDGFIAGLHTLKKFPQKNKIIISRGIIELGIEKRSSYQHIIDEIEKTSIRLFTTDMLFKDLNKHEHVKCYTNEIDLLQELQKELSADTIILIEGRFPEKDINNILEL